MANPEPVPDDRQVSDVAVSLIRTWVPIGVGALLAWAAAHWHIVLSDTTSASVGAAAAAVCAAGWYALARFLEKRAGDGWAPVLARTVGKWMLGGVVRQPVYALMSENIVVQRADGTLRSPR